jgi:hypothetical protein
MWVSINPGITVRPFRSMLRAAGEAGPQFVGADGGDLAVFYR